MKHFFSDKKTVFSNLISNCEISALFLIGS